MKIRNLTEMVQDAGFGYGTLGPAHHAIKYVEQPKSPIKNIQTTEDWQAHNAAAAQLFLSKYGKINARPRSTILDEEGRLIGIQTPSMTIYLDTPFMDLLDLYELYMTLSNPPFPILPLNVVSDKGAFFDLDGDGVADTFLPRALEDYAKETFQRYGIDPTPGVVPSWWQKNIKSLSDDYWYLKSGKWWDDLKDKVGEAVDWFEDAWGGLFGE